MTQKVASSLAHMKTNFPTSGYSLFSKKKGKGSNTTCKGKQIQIIRQFSFHTSYHFWWIYSPFQNVLVSTKQGFILECQGIVEAFQQRNKGKSVKYSIFKCFIRRSTCPYFGQNREPGIAGQMEKLILYSMLICIGLQSHEISIISFRLFSSRIFSKVNFPV